MSKQNAVVKYVDILLYKENGCDSDMFDEKIEKRPHELRFLKAVKDEK